MNERDYIPKVLRYAREHIPYSCAIEVKLARGSSLSFSALAEHQEHALLLASNDGMAWKIPDCGFQNPFDAFTFKNTAAYVVVIFPPTAYFVPIEAWCAAQEKTTRKSCTIPMAVDYAAYECRV